MALDDVIKYGKKAIATEAIRARFLENPTYGAVSDLARADKVGEVDRSVYDDLAEGGVDLAPARVAKTLDDALIAYQLQIASALDNPREALSKLRDDPLLGYLLAVKPLKADSELGKLHASAAEGKAILEDPESMKRSLKSYVGSRVDKLIKAKTNPALIALYKKIAEISPDAITSRILKDANAAVSALRNAVLGNPDEVRKYALERYESSPEKSKHVEAYTLGKAVAAAA
jgi:hypothetical protein